MPVGEGERKVRLVEMCRNGIFSAPLVPPRPSRCTAFAVPQYCLAGPSRVKGLPGLWWMVPYCVQQRCPAAASQCAHPSPGVMMEGGSETDCVLQCQILVHSQL